MEITNREYMRDYMEKNKEKYKIKTKCFCGGSFDTIHRARHLRSKRHCKAVNEKLAPIPLGVGVSSTHSDKSPQHTHK